MDLTIFSMGRVADAIAEIHPILDRDFARFLQFAYAISPNVVAIDISKILVRPMKKSADNLVYDIDESKSTPNLAHKKD